MSTVYMQTEIDTYKDNDKTGTKTVILYPVDQGNYYYFVLTGITAVNMNDRFRSVIYGVKDGQPYYSAVDDYSVADYAYSQLKKTTTSNSLKILCADLLRYGGAAQTYKGYRTDALVSDAMTEEHKLYLSDIDGVTFNYNNRVLDDVTDPPHYLAW